MDHSHEKITYLAHVTLPYGLTPQDLNFEPDLLNNQAEALRTLAIWDDAEVKRVIVAAAALLDAYPHRTAAEALETAMIWERG